MREALPRALEDSIPQTTNAIKTQEVTDTDKIQEATAIHKPQEAASFDPPYSVAKATQFALEQSEPWPDSPAGSATNPILIKDIGDQESIVKVHLSPKGSAISNFFI